MSRCNAFFDYKMPKRKKNLLTDDFLKTFKEELDNTFNVDDSKIIHTYIDYYGHIAGTGGFYKALEMASKKHNLHKAIYNYACKLPWYQSDLLDDELLLIMVERGIIPLGSEEDECECLSEMERTGEIRWVEKTVQKNGYRVITRDWEFTT